MKKLITERDIIDLERQGIKVLVKSKDIIITPLAADRIRASKFSVVEKEISQTKNLHSPETHQSVYLLSCHYDENSCDYPDYAKKVATKVAKKEFDFGILIDATGIPSAIVANKIKGIRAATCYNAFSARSSRAHNNSNVLVVGARALGEETIKLIIDEWLSTSFEAGRHQKRLDKITDIENE